MKTFKFSLVLRTRENTDVFISLDDNIYGIHSKRVNIFYMSRVKATYFALFKKRRIFLLYSLLDVVYSSSSEVFTI